ncbi:MAG: hypothetical protein GYA46_09070, partial [candidate division Zixibacteria bacterium]|nr:hypothetical protein [candidate division Zixibacteria bacterium]
MKKFWTVFACEYAQVVKKKSFLVGIILTPAVMVLITILPAMLIDKGISAPESYVVVDADGRGIGAQFAAALERYKLDSDSTLPAYKLVGVYDIPGDRPQALDSIRG